MPHYNWPHFYASFLPLDLKIGYLIDKKVQPCTISITYFSISHPHYSPSPWIKLKKEKGESQIEQERKKTIVEKKGAVLKREMWNFCTLIWSLTQPSSLSFFFFFFLFGFLENVTEKVVEICNPKFIVVVFLCNFIYFVEICKLKFIIVFCTHLCLVFEKIKGKLQNSNP